MSRTIRTENPVRGIASLVRPTTSLLAGILALTSFSATHGAGDIKDSLAVFVAGFCLCMFGFAINDIQDIEKDRLSGRLDKPLVTKTLSVGAASCLAATLCAITLGLSLNLGTYAGYVGFGGLVALSLYSPAARAAPLMKGVFTAFLTCFPLLLGFTAAGAGVPLTMLGSIIIFISGREIIIDLDDQDFDRRVGLRTIPYYIGSRWSLRLGSSLMFGGLALVFFANDTFLGRLSAAAAFTILVAVIALHKKIGVVGIVSWSRVPMLIAMLTLIDLP